MGSTTSKDEKLHAAIIQQRIEYNEKMTYALNNRLRRIQEFNPRIHGNWLDFKSFLDIMFVEDLHYGPEYISYKKKR
jgi:hypothetical protein